MGECLSDDELVLVYYGEEKWRSEHLTRCLSCVARFRALSADLETIRTVLTETSAGVSPRSRRWRGLAIAAALAGVSVIGVTEVWIWHAARWMTAVASEVDPDTSAFLDRVSTMLSTGDDQITGGEDQE
jgi:hypothetical protein